MLAGLRERGRERGMVRERGARGRESERREKKDARARALIFTSLSSLTWNGRDVSFWTMAGAPIDFWPSKVRMDSFCGGAQGERERREGREGYGDAR